MVRTLSLFLGLFCALFLFSSPAHAQLEDKVEVFGGYAYMRFNPNGASGTNLNGWEASAQYKFTDWLGGVADFSGDYGTVTGVSSSSVHTFLFGPQVSFPARVSPFAHVLLGGAHFSFGQGGPSDTGFASAVGAGFDAKVGHGISWRIVQGDWLHTSFFGAGQNNARISTGIVFRF
jgi:hypothetical protein